MKQTTRAILFFALAACALQPFRARAGTPSWTALRGARIVTGNGAVIEKGTVLIRGGVIAAVSAQVNLPASAWVIDAQGLTVYPGLIDALSTWGMAEAAAPAPTAGRGTAQAQPQVPAEVRSRGPADRPGTNSWLLAADLVKPTDARLVLARNAGFTTAVTFPRQGIVAGHGAVVNLAGKTGGEMVVSPDAGLFLALQPSGYTGFPSTPMGIMAYFRQLWIDADHYRLAQAMYAKDPRNIPRPAYDRALEGIAEVRRILLPASGPVQLERALKLASDLKAPAVIYGVVEGYAMAQRLKEAGVPAIVNVKWPARASDSDPEAEDSLRVLRMRDQAPTSPAALAEAGVRFAVSSDGLDAPRDVIRMFRQSIGRGLKKEDALRALTLGAAEIFGVSGKLGSVEAGKIANLTVTDGDLFDEKSRVRMTFIDGERYLPVPEAPRAGPGAGGRSPSAEQEER